MFSFLKLLFPGGTNQVFFSVFMAFLFGFLNVFKTTIYCVFVILFFV